MKNIIEALNWRYATKLFDPTKKIDQDQLDIILETLRLSPSSYGMQPWKFVLVNNLDLRLKIKEAAYGQPQTTDASHLIILTVKKDIDAKLVNDYMNFVAGEKNIEVVKLGGFETMINGSFQNKSMEELKSWATHQLYLAAGTLLTSCATLEIDACPMEGFDKAKVDEILGLASLGLESRLIVPIGYRSTSDQGALAKKLRFSKEDVFIEMN